MAARGAAAVTMRPPTLRKEGRCGLGGMAGVKKLLERMTLWGVVLLGLVAQPDAAGSSVGEAAMGSAAMESGSNLLPEIVPAEMMRIFERLSKEPEPAHWLAERCGRSR